MDQEFLVEKQNFTITKEKIIKTHELLLLYNEKNETLNKAKNAFKQLKSKYEATIHEVDRLKLDNERLNFNLETLKSKSQQNEKDLDELRTDYKRTDERYQLTMIESQQAILQLEEKVKYCTCNKDVLLTTTGRSPTDKVKELKQKCTLLMKSESNLKNDCDSLQLKNKQLTEEITKKLKCIKDLTAKNAELQNNLNSFKKVQKIKIESKEHLNLQQTLKSLKQSHEKEIHSLKMEISKLSLDNQRIRYLELECQNLKQQINRKKDKTFEKSNMCVQTEISYFNEFNSKQDIGMQPMQTLKVLEDDSSDLDYAVNDILSEMIVPKALSPMSFSSRMAESPTPFLNIFEPLPSMDEKMFVPTPIPNIVITPPTPSADVGNNSKVVFRLPTEHAEKKNIDPAESAVVVPELEHMKEIAYSRENDPIQSTTTISPVVVAKEITLQKQVEESQQKIEYSNKNTAPTRFFNSFAADTTEDHPDTTNTVSICKKSAQAGLETSKRQDSSEDGILGLKGKFQRRRKFWVPCDLNSFVKLRRKQKIIKAKETKKYREISKQPKDRDTILNALKTLQQNNINFTISNDSIPLVQPYNCYSLLTPPKTEPLTVSRRFPDTFSDSLGCWNKQCTRNNTQMLLRKLPNKEEPELLGFFSIKSEVITPAASRMDVAEKPKPVNDGDIVSQLLNGIKELLEVKRKDSLRNRRKKRAKSKSRRSDFYSETETELEKLFRTSADVLGRNREFLAAAKERHLESNGESVFESESDAMIDSGLVTGTPKIDSDTMSICSQYELGEKVPDNMFNPIIRNDDKVVQDDILQSCSDFRSSPKDNDGFAGFSLSNRIKSESIKNNCINNCTTPKFPTCPVMISPIASSKGSPETLHLSSTPFKTLEFSGNIQASPFCFKQPFCPDLLSPMSSSKGSPASQTLKGINEESVDSFGTPLGSIMVSPLTLYSETSLDNCSKKSATVKEPAEDINDGKPLCSEIKKSVVCQRITFDSFANNDKSRVDLYISDVENLPDLAHQNLATFTNVISASSTNINQDYSTISILPEGNTEQLNNSTETTIDKLKPLEKVDESTLHIDLSIKSTDLHYTLEDISLSQLELTSITPEPGGMSANNSYSDTEQVKSNKNISTKIAQRRYSLRQTLQSEKKHELKPIKFVFPQPEKRYSLRSVSQCEGKNDLEPILSETEKRYSLRTSQCESKNSSPALEAMKMSSSDTDDDVDFSLPRTRGAKRKFKKDLSNEDNENSTVTKLLMLAEHDRVPMPRQCKTTPDRMASKEIDSPRKRKEKTHNPSQDGNVSETSESKVKNENGLKIEANIAEDLFDSELKGEKSSSSETKTESSELQAQDVVRKELSDINKAVCIKNWKIQISEKCHRNRKVISKEFVSESESECDVPSEYITKTGSSVRVEEKHLLDIKEKHTSDIVNIEVSANKTNLGNSKVVYTEDRVEKKEEASMTESRSCIQGSNSSQQAITFEIQNILSSIYKEQDQPKNIFVSSDISDNNATRPGKSNASRPSVTDLFGEVSDSEEESCDRKDLKVIAKSRRIVGKTTLRSKMLKQVRGTVYASTKNKPRDNIMKSGEHKPVNVLSNGSVSLEEKQLKVLPENRVKEKKKINIVQNILISNGKTINLLSNNEKGKSLSAVTNSKSLSDGPSKPDQKKRMKLEHKVSNTGTPVDILSQVMRGMIKTGPKLARKNTSNLVPFRQGQQNNFYNVRNSIGEKHNQQKVIKPLRAEENLAVNVDVDEYLDCPKSPDVLELPDRLPKWIPTEKPERLPGSKVQVLFDKLMVFCNEEKMVDDVIQKFAFQDMTFVIQIILEKLSYDYHDKADNLYPPSPPMTSTQRILLGFLLKLEKSTHPGIKEQFLKLSELRLFNKFTCTLEIVQPITRMYTAICKLSYNMNRIRRFICEGFYFIGELAVPLFFTVLTMWPDVLPMESKSSDHLLMRVLVQLCYLKECTTPGHNLIPLRDLLRKYYGYPTERWNCEDIFMEILVEYIRNPSIRLSDFTLLLFLKNKPTKWVYQKVKDVIMPLYQQVPDSNPNLKSTLVILLGNICGGFLKYQEYDWSVILEMDSWFMALDKDDLDPLIKRAIHLARGRLPRRALRKRKKNANKNAENENNVDSSKTHDCIEELTPDNNREGTIEDSCKANSIEDIGRPSEENRQCTNNYVNIDNKLECNNELKDTCSVESEEVNTLSHDEENDCANSDSDIEF